jgi:hypothetical protein
MAREIQEASLILEDKAITCIDREKFLQWLLIDSLLFFLTIRGHHTKIWRPDIYRKREEDGVKEKI